MIVQEHVVAADEKDKIPELVHLVTSSTQVHEDSRTAVKSWPLLHPKAPFHSWTFEEIEKMSTKFGHLISKGSDVAAKQAIGCLVVLFEKGGLCVSEQVQAVRPFDVLFQHRQLLLILDEQKTIRTNVLASIVSNQVIENVLQQFSGAITTSSIQSSLLSNSETKHQLPSWVIADSSQHKEPRSFAVQMEASGGSQVAVHKIVESLPFGWKSAKDFA